MKITSDSLLKSLNTGKNVKLYCKYYLQDWDEEEETYTMCSTGDYYAIELD